MTTRNTPITLANGIAIPDTHLQARLSEAFINAVAAQAGCAATFITHDYGLDVELNPVRFEKNGIPFNMTGWTLHCQIKSTVNYTMQLDYITYDMPAKAYNRLASWEGTTPCYLIVYCLPKNKREWLMLDENTCTLKHCAYWFRIGNELLPKGTTQKRILIPRKQLFIPSQVSNLIAGIQRGKFL